MVDAVSASEDSFNISTQDKFAKIDRPGFAPTLIDDKVSGKNMGQNPAVHSKLRQREFEFVHVTIVTDIFRLGHCLKTSTAVEFDVGRDIRIPPVSVHDNVGENPTVADQLLIADLGQHRNRKGHLWEGIEEFPIQNQRCAMVEQILSLEYAVLVDTPVNADHQIKWQLVFSTEFSQSPKYEAAERV